MVTLNPSFPQSEMNYKFKPDMTVYVPVMLDDDLFDSSDIYPPLM